MDRQNRIVWNEGMFLGPHHFQQWDRYFQNELVFRQRLISQFGWGVRSLVIDEDALPSGRLNLREFEAVLPDGTIIRAPEIDPLPTGRLLSDVFDPDNPRLEIFIAIPATRAGIPVCSSTAGDGTAESPLFSEVVQVEDLNKPGKKMDLNVGCQNLKLMVSGERLDGHVSLKIAEVVRSSDGTLEMDPDFAPASLTLKTAGPVLDVVRGILEALTGQSTMLSTQARQRGDGMVEFGSSDVGNFWLLHTINTHLPVVAHFLRTPNSHPHQLYLSLVQLAGALCTFATDRHPRDLPEYSHELPGRTFRTLGNHIRDLLETVMPSRYATVPLALNTEGILSGKIQDERMLEPDAHWFLSVSGDLPEQQVRDELPGRVIIGSPYNLDFLVRTATPGVKFSHVPVPPRDFPLKVGHTYFKLETHGETWNTVVESRAIAIYLGGAELRDLSFEMIIMS